MTEQSTDLRETVRRRYAAAAVQVTWGGSACCGPAAIEIDDNLGFALYNGNERDTLPAEAVAASPGRGNPPWSPTCTKETGSWTSAPAAASTSSFRCHQSCRLRRKSSALLVKAGAAARRSLRSATRFWN